MTLMVGIKCVYGKDLSNKHHILNSKDSFTSVGQNEYKTDELTIQNSPRDVHEVIPIDLPNINGFNPYGDNALGRQFWSSLWSFWSNDHENDDNKSKDVDGEMTKAANKKKASVINKLGVMETGETNKQAKDNFLTVEKKEAESMIDGLNDEALDYNTATANDKLSPIQPSMSNKRNEQKEPEINTDGTNNISNQKHRNIYDNSEIKKEETIPIALSTENEINIGAAELHCKNRHKIL